MGGKASKEKADFWRPDESSEVCEICERRFTFFRRRHHCRACGCLTCDDCSKTRTFIPNRGLSEKARTCTMCAVQLQAQSAIEAEAAGRTPRGAITPRPSMMRFREDQTDSRSGATGGVPVGDSPNNTRQTLLTAAEDEPRLCTSAPTSPTRASAPAALPTRGATQRTPLKGKQGARATILNPTRRRTIFAYLCAVQRSLLVQFPKPAVELLVEYLSQVFFLESIVTPPPKECLVARNKCSVILGCFKQSSLPASQRPGPDSDEGEADGGVRTPTAGGGDAPIINIRPAAVYVTPVLPGDLATEFHFTVTVRRTQHFAMEVGVVHQSFLPAGSGAAGSTGGVSGGYGSSQALKRAASTVKPLDMSKGVRVCALSSNRIPPVGIELPSREPLTLESSSQQSNAIEVDQATESVLYLSVYWDGLSRTATFSATDLKPVELGKRGQASAAVMPRATPVSTSSSRNIFAPPPSQNSLAGGSPMPSSGSLPNSQRIFGAPGLLSSSIRSNSGLLFESPVAGAPGVDCAPVQLQLPPAVSGRWSLVLSCESAADVRIQML